mgnify:CR=1 FL=1
MNLIKLLINELIKILRKKSTFLFFMLSIIAVIVSCLVIKFKDYSIMENYANNNTDEYELKNAISLDEKKKFSAQGKDIDMYQERIDVAKKLLESGVEKVLDTSYKQKIYYNISKEIENLYKIDEQLYSDLYKEKRQKIQRLDYLLYNGTFEEYIDFNKDEIEEEYKKEVIDLKTYKSKMEEINMCLKYEIDKYDVKNTYWKKQVLENIDLIDSTIENRIDYTKKIFIDDKQVKTLREDNLINIYRLENNIAPYYTDQQYYFNETSYMRYHYNMFANYSSMLFIGLLVIFLASSSISEEFSKKTIKFLLITPNKRYKVLISKILSILIILIISTLIVSQISVIVGNVAFGISTNNYLYVSNGNVNVMDTHLYETLQYMLKMPEIIVYMFLAIALSTLTKNTAISTTICTTLYIIMPTALKILGGFISLDFLRFLPFRNLDFVSEVFRVNTYEVVYLLSTFEPSVKFSLNIVLLTIILLIITSFESFNKDDI